MIEAICAICGSDDYAVIAKRDAYFEPARNVICRVCGLVYLNPIMSDEELRQYYAQYRIRTTGMHKPDEAFLDLSYRLGRMRLRHISEYLVPGKKILDVGCGHGYILDLARDLGCECVGVEPDPGFSEYARRIYGLRVYTSLFEDLSLEKEIGTFNVVTFQHTFEHFRNPAAILKKVGGLLREDGVLNMDVPNLDTPRGGFLWQDLYMEHTHTYTPRTLRLLLLKCGFEIIKMDTAGYVTSNNHHVPLMNVTARKGEPRTDLDYSRDGDDFRTVLWRLKMYRLRHFILGGGWRFYLVNLPMHPEKVRIQGRVNQGVLWTSPIARLLPAPLLPPLTRLLRRTIRPYMFEDFSLPPAKDYSIRPAS